MPTLNVNKFMLYRTLQLNVIQAIINPNINPISPRRHTVRHTHAINNCHYLNPQNTHANENSGHTSGPIRTTISAATDSQNQTLDLPTSSGELN